MTTKTNDKCGTKSLCNYDSAIRTQFFHGMLLTDDHLRADQSYHREALRRVNRYLWGTGIVCGLEVDAKGLCLKVQPGAGLDCRGNLIEVCKCITIDLWEDCKKKYPDACVPATAAPYTKYLVLRYAEITSDPEPVLSSSGDCPDSGQTKCQPAKVREGFCLELVDECPAAKVCPDDQEGPLAAFLTVRGKYLDEQDARDEMKKIAPDCMKLSPPCPECDCCECDECEICLAKLTIDCVNKTVEVGCDCRSYVWSPRMLRWLVCALLARLDKHVPIKNPPTSNEVAYQPMNSAWRVASEFAAARSRAKNLEDRFEDLATQVKALSQQVTKAKKEPKTKS
jgi:hypothetical protein